MGRAKELLFLLPRLARLIAGVIGDASVPRSAKIALGAVLLYLASPIDVIPDFIPFVGWLDDVLLVAVVVDGLLSFVDRAVLLRYWPGSPASLDTTAGVARQIARWVPRRLKARIFGGPLAR